MRQHIKKAIERPYWTIGAAMAIFVIVITAIGAWKLYYFRYNALDLAIYEQVFWNTAHGHFFAASIHPPSYLGDHVEWIILLLLPLWGILRFAMSGPLALVLLQAIALASPALIIYTIALKRLESKNWALIFALCWLLNPLVWNAALFEFHALVFAIPLLLLVFHFWRERNVTSFVIATAGALLVREDVALVIIFFGIWMLATLEMQRRYKSFSHKHFWKWENVRWPAIAIGGGLLTFIIAMIAGRLASGGGSYKFLVYYQWIAPTVPGMFKAVFTELPRILTHLVGIGNIEMVLGLIMAFIFLPLVAPRYLLLGCVPAAMLMLGSGGGGSLVLETHYWSLFAPALVFASIEGLATVLEGQRGQLCWQRIFKKLPSVMQSDKRFWIAVGMVSVTYVFCSLGPLPGTLRLMAGGLNTHEVARASTIRDMLKDVDPGAPVAASYNMLVPLADRTKLVSMNYAVLGTQQFARGAYVLPADVQAILFDTRDLLTYELQFRDSGAYTAYYPNIGRNIASLFAEREFVIRKVQNGIALLDTTGPHVLPLPLHTISDSVTKGGSDVELKSADAHITPNTGTEHTMGVSIDVVVVVHQRPSTQAYAFGLVDTNGTLVSELLPVASFDGPGNWKAGEIITTTEHVLMNSARLGTSLVFNLYAIRGGLQIAADRSSVNVLDTKKVIAQVPITWEQ